MTQYSFCKMIERPMESRSKKERNVSKVVDLNRGLPEVCLNV